MTQIHEDVPINHEHETRRPRQAVVTRPDRWRLCWTRVFAASILVVAASMTAACSGGQEGGDAGGAAGGQGSGGAAGTGAGTAAGLVAFTGATIIDGAGGEPFADGVLLVRGGRIEAVGAAGDVAVPAGAERVDLSGRTVLPGLINAHGHVGGTRGLESGHYSEDNVVDHLRLYARYGITTANSLGDDGDAAIAVRAAEDAPDLDRARLLFAGPVVGARTAEEARAQVDEIAAMEPDFIKIRVDDNLGAGRKMPPEAYRATIEAAHAHGIRHASHLFYLDDAKDLLASGTDLVAHSVRDQPVDEQFIDLLIDNEVCYCPTLTREISTFVYESEPEFFADPFFLAEADPAVIEALKDPARQARYRGAGPDAYKQALQVALANLKAVVDGGATVAMGTDSGPPARFQGYFEHLELELMAEAGLTPMQIIVASTGDAARCLGLTDRGTLSPGKLADFVVVTADPLADITNTRTIESVWISGNRVPPRD
jgi:imidazolonepropionase-like amidohydrolase